MLLGATLVLALAWPARGAEAASQAQVQTDGAEVRCKPGAEPAVYVTQKLARGDIVQVVRKTNDGWLEIVPPKGSYSWVNTRQLRRAAADQRVWLVSADDGPVSVLVGSPFKSGKPDVVGATLKRGTQVVAVGEPRPSEDGDGVWLPIIPPPGEYRYVREKDVVVLPPSPGSAATTTVAQPGSAFADPTTGRQPTAGSASQALPPPSNDVHVGGTAAAADGDALQAQAEQLERSGDRTGAARLYDQLGTKYFNSNHDRAMQYYNRAAWLRQGQPAAPSSRAEADALYQQAQQNERASNWAGAIRAYEQLVEVFRYSNPPLAKQYYDRAMWLRSRRLSAPTAKAPAVPQSGVVQAGGVVSGLTGQTGRLMRSRTWIDGRATYVVESPQAQILAYVLPQPGVDLERYVNQNVEVIGQVVPNADVRGPVLTVTKVRLLSAP
jgi:hypothetical protein